MIGAGSKKSPSNDDVETVVHNFEQMMTLLVGEEGIDGMPGPIVYFLLEKEVSTIQREITGGLLSACSFIETRFW